MFAIAGIGSAVACGGTVVTGNYSVLASGIPVSTVGDATSPCPKKPPGSIVTGNYSVLVTGRPCARIGSVQTDGSPIVTGNYTVLLP
tara:strand:+ start:3205 stop:3465 length:261 start_codon:yes stop_codon:yes gene_type:complete